MSNLTNILSLNEEGLNAFRGLLSNRKKNKILSPVEEIAFDKKFTSETSFKAKIDLDKKFKDRYDIAKYLNNIMHNEFIANKDQYEQDIGLWSWIALVYFDQISEVIRANDNYILNTHPQRWYRHCIFGPYYLFERYGDHSRLYISGNITEMGNGIEQAISRNFLMSNKVARELMTILYADPNNNGIAKKDTLSTTAKKAKQILKNGKASKRGYGGIARFSSVFKQIRLTCYVHTISPSMLLEMMGDEFKKWVD